MNSAKTLTAKEIAELKKRPIDFSVIPELTSEQAKELYPKNWRPRKQPVSAYHSYVKSFFESQSVPFLTCLKILQKKGANDVRPQ